eukprot:sb/3476491/
MSVMVWDELGALRQLTETSQQPIRTRYLGHVTGNQPIRHQYFLFLHSRKAFIAPFTMQLAQKTALSETGRSYSHLETFTYSSIKSLTSLLSHIRPSSSHRAEGPMRLREAPVRPRR